MNLQHIKLMSGINLKSIFRTTGSLWKKITDRILKKVAPLH
jgi:hypothetical protein